MLDTIRLASTEDLDEIWMTLVEVCRQMSHDRYSPQWTLGVYPSKDDVMEAIAQCSFYVGILDGRIVATMIVRQRDDDEYANVPWPSGLSGNEVSTGHLVAVHPSLRGKGIGAELVRFHAPGASAPSTWTSCWATSLQAASTLPRASRT